MTASSISFFAYCNSLSAFAFVKIAIISTSFWTITIFHGKLTQAHYYMSNIFIIY